MRGVIVGLHTPDPPQRTHRGRDRRSGAVLLEAIVAITVLAIVMSGTAWMTTEALASLTRAQSAESEMRGASRFLTAVSLWSATELDRRLGITEQGPWLLRIDRITEHLYDVTIMERRPGNPSLLHTTLFRGPEGEDR
jgi:hypothetical protein